MASNQEQTPGTAQGRFVRSAGILAGGTVLSQLIVLFSTPFLTRLFDPSDFGVLAVFVSVVSICVVPATLRYEQAIPVAETDEEAYRLLLVSLGAVVVVGCSIAVLAVLVEMELIVGTLIGEIYPYVWFVLAAVLGAGAYQALLLHSIRIGAYSKISQTRVVKNLALVGVQLGSGFVGLGVLGLILGEVANRIFGVMSLARLSALKILHAARASSMSSISGTAKKFWRYPVVSTPSALVNVAGFHLPVLLLSGWFGASVVGWFALSSRILQAPISIIGQAISQAFFSEVGEQFRLGHLSERVSEVTRLLLRLGTSPSIVIVAVGPDLFLLVFGEEWIQAGVYSRWLMPWLYMTFIASPLSTLVYVYERQGAELIFQVLLTAFRIGALWVGFALDSSNLAVALFALTSAVVWLFYFIWIIRVSESGDVSLMKCLILQVGMGVIFCIPYVLVSYLGYGDLYIICAIATSVGVSIAWSLHSVRLSLSGKVSNL